MADKNILNAVIPGENNFVVMEEAVTASASDVVLIDYEHNDNKPHG